MCALQTLFITGATSPIGQFLCTQLLEQNQYQLVALTRDRARIPAALLHPAITWLEGDFTQPAQCHALVIPPIDAVIHIPPIWTLPAILPFYQKLGIKRLICFSSTSRFTKIDSHTLHEQHVVDGLTRGETETIQFCQQHDIAWTIFRPTLIYGTKNDKNISMIVRVIRRFGFFPLAGKAHGKRQPVHAADLATACVQALAEKRSYNHAYNLSGGSTVTYREMVKLLFIACACPPRLITIPSFLLKTVIQLVKLLPRFRYLSTDMIDRMNQDLYFEHTTAHDDFGYTPRPLTVEILSDIYLAQ